MVATPLPLLRVLDQTSFDGVTVHVAQLLNSLCVSEDVEVVVTGFPDELFFSCAGESLFQDLDGGG